jgi:hypothetical protein
MMLTIYDAAHSERMKIDLLFHDFGAIAEAFPIRGAMACVDFFTI